MTPPPARPPSRPTPLPLVLLLVAAGLALSPAVRADGAEPEQPPAPPAVVVPAPAPAAPPLPAVLPTPAPVAVEAPAPTPRPVPPATPAPMGEAGTVPQAPANAAPPPAAEPAAAPEPFTVPVESSDLWARIRANRGIPDLEDSWVEQRERYYSTRPDYVARMVDRGSRYLFHIVEEVERRKLPSELALLPFIESAFNPQAMSTAKASGMWQFIPSTGRDFDLKQNLFRDDRRSVVASTEAALDYLEKLYAMFGDWHLALAAYNWGQGNVQRAIDRNRRAGLPTDYLSLRMPRETRDYVPKLQAIENILMNPAAYGIGLAPLANQAFFTPVTIERDIDVDLAARLAGLSVEEFKALNPQMNKPVILAAGTPEILLPRDAALMFLAAVGRHTGPLASWTAWTAPQTLRVAEAAERVGMTEAELREVNRIPPRMLVRAGSTLLVARAPHKEADVPEHVADNAMLALAPDAPARRRISVAARSGDTLASVARRHRVSAADLAEWNRLSPNARLRQGQQLVVFAPAARAQGTRTATRSQGTRVASATPARGASSREVSSRKSGTAARGGGQGARKPVASAPRAESTRQKSASRNTPTRVAQAR